MEQRGAAVAIMAAALVVSLDAWAGERTNVRLRREAERRRVERVLDGAARRLGAAGCSDLLATFEAQDGRPLAEVLAASGQEPARYLDTLFFYDGGRDGRCANGDVLAVTNPGAPVVLVCSAFYRHSQRDPEYAEATLVHEALHTLGLGENPPSPREITDRVLKHCR